MWNRNTVLEVRPGLVIRGIEVLVDLNGWVLTFDKEKQGVCRKPKLDYQRLKRTRS